MQLKPPTLSQCPICGNEYKSLSQHWRRSASCDYPDIDERLHKLIRGLLASDGTLDGSRAALVEVQGTRYRHIKWLHEGLDWLSRGITVTDRPDEITNGVIYRLRTMAHPALDQYWTTDEYDLTAPESLRVIYACDGSLSFAGVPRTSRRIVFRAEGSRDMLQSALEAHGIESTYNANDGRVSVPSDDVERLLELVAPPIPGSEYKWADNLTEYSDIKDVVESVEQDYARWSQGLLQAEIRDD